MAIALLNSSSSRSWPPLSSVDGQFSLSECESGVDGFSSPQSLARRFRLISSTLSVSTGFDTGAFSLALTGFLESVQLYKLGSSGDVNRTASAWHSGSVPSITNMVYPSNSSCLR